MGQKVSVAIGHHVAWYVSHHLLLSLLIFVSFKLSAFLTSFYEAWSRARSVSMGRDVGDHLVQPHCFQREKMKLREAGWLPQNYPAQWREVGLTHIEAASGSDDKLKLCGHTHRGLSPSPALVV